VSQTEDKPDNVANPPMAQKGLLYKKQFFPINANRVLSTGSREAN